MIATGIRVSTVLLATLLATGACGQGEPPPPPPAPAGAVNGLGEGETVTAASLAMTDLRRRLDKHFDGPWEHLGYRLPAGTGWDTLTAHYAGELGSTWTEDTRYPEDGGTGYRSKVWRDGDFSAGIALVEGRPPADGAALIVLVSEDD
jgi:hypothetical protein